MQRYLVRPRRVGPAQEPQPPRRGASRLYRTLADRCPQRGIPRPPRRHLPPAVWLRLRRADQNSRMGLQSSRPGPYNRILDRPRTLPCVKLLGLGKDALESSVTFYAQLEHDRYERRHFKRSNLKLERRSSALGRARQSPLQSSSESSGGIACPSESRARLRATSSCRSL